MDIRQYLPIGFPRIICLCGSTRFKNEFVRQNFQLTLAGNIVLSIGCNAKDDSELKITDYQKIILDDIHKRKIDLADEIFVINVNKYIVYSTKSEIKYAMDHGKKIVLLEEMDLLELGLYE